MRSWGWGPNGGISVLVSRREARGSSLSLRHEDTVSKKVALFKPGRRPSLGTESAGILSWTYFPACRTVRNKYLLFKLPISGILLQQTELRLGLCFLGFKWLNLCCWGSDSDWLWSSYYTWPTNNVIKSYSMSSYIFAFLRLFKSFLFGSHLLKKSYTSSNQC